MTSKRALILSDFTDAGSGEAFTKGDTPLIEVGAYDNYAAAGLVSAAPAAKGEPTTAPKRRGRKPKAQPADGSVPALADPAPVAAGDIDPAPDA